MQNQAKSLLNAPATWLQKAIYAFTNQAPASTDIPESALEANVRALLRELESTAQRVAISCAIANAIDEGRANVAHHVVRHFPERPAEFTAILHGTKPLYLDRDSIASFAALYEATALAVEFASTYDNSRMRVPVNCAPAWQSAARHAVEAIYQADVLVRNLGATYRIPDTKDLISALEAVAQGATQGVNHDGTVNSPIERDDRNRIRYPKSVPATLQFENGTAPVILRNMSTGGCGVSTTRHFLLGTEVTLILPDKSQFVGTISWSLGLSAGIEFTTPITEAEAMFAGERKPQK